MSHQMEAAFCRAVEVPLAELELLLSSDAGQRLSNSAPVLSAQAVYDDLSEYVAYIPFVGDDCDRHTTEAWKAANSLRVFLTANANDVPPPIRPDASQEPPGYGKGLGGLLGLGIGAFIISKLAPLFGRRKEK